MERRSSRTSSSAASRAKPTLGPVPDGARRSDESTLKSPVETISTISSVSSPRSNGSASNLQELRFIVTGSAGCGKTTFIQKALDLKRPISSSSTCKKMSLDGQVFLINLIEVPLERVGNNNGKVVWPSKTENIDITRVDGVLALYDVTKKASLSRIPPVLTSCSQDATPCVLVSCKCDFPDDERFYNPDEVEERCMEETSIEGVQLSGASDSHKRCISVVLRNYIEAEQSRNPRAHSRRPRAMTAASPSPNPKMHGSRSKHNRATSEVPTSNTKHYADTRSGRGAAQKPSAQVPPVLERPTQTDTSGGGEGFSRDHHPTMSLDNIPIHPSKPSMGTPTTIANSFIDFDAGPEVEESGTQETSGHGLEESSPAGGFMFEELVERLLAQPVSRADHKFIATFLCLYRKFAAPSELYASVLESFESVQKSSKPQLWKLSAQLRHLAILEQWLGSYPGDFAHPFLRQLVSDFIKKIAGERVFAIAAYEMTAHLDSITEDDDTNWAASDKRRGRIGVVRSLTRVPSLSSEMSTLLADSIYSEAWTETSKKGSKASTHSKSSSNVSSMDKKAAISMSSASAMLINSVEAAQRQADMLLHTARVSLTKVSWHQFMDASEDDLAKELTRLDRILYSAIRPRDLIRHVSLSNDQREECRGLEYVTQMIDQFNHVAFWVTNLLLLREKAKHRARALEKFMKVAIKLRRLNNYNGLGAVLAGINSTATHRLIQTRELVSPSVSKDFMRLEILMGSSKSHFAYRLAWENTTGDRIPFLPLHRRDLVSAEEGNKTFLNVSEDRINWKKFEIMGDVIIGIQDSQITGFQQQLRNPELQRLILETKLCKDEEELYERSCFLEPPRANESRRRFNWFQR